MTKTQFSESFLELYLVLKNKDYRVVNEPLPFPYYVKQEKLSEVEMLIHVPSC